MRVIIAAAVGFAAARAKGGPGAGDAITTDAVLRDDFAFCDFRGHPQEKIVVKIVVGAVPKLARVAEALAHGHWTIPIRSNLFQHVLREVMYGLLMNIVGND